MRVLIACEESQAVTKEFRKLGHEAYSCDILPCSGGHPEWHFHCDVDPIMKDPWDMIIAFPPCTDIAVSGSKWFKEKIADGRQQEGIDFFMKFANSECPSVAIENPIGVMSSKWRKPDQIIQPYEYGDPFTKTTCLWLKGLPKLKPTDIVDGGKIVTLSSGVKIPEWYSNASVKDRGKIRSKTFEGIARAMAEQWGDEEAVRKAIRGKYTKFMNIKKRKRC